MPSQEEGRYISDVIKYEIAEYSRDYGILLAGSGELQIGSVLGQNADGKFVPLNVEATTGEEVAVGILLSKANAGISDNTLNPPVDVKIIVGARHIIVVDDSLIFPNGINDIKKANALAELKSIGIITKKGV